MSHEIDLFSYTSYKPYLEARLGGKNQRKGAKSRLAESMNCQSTYLSQVLHGSAHLSLEQAAAANQFFSHGKEAAHFFLLLVQKDRAGTPALRDYFREQIEEVTKRRLHFTQRLGARAALPETVMAEYYSHWWYLGVHIATSIPTLQTREALRQALQIPQDKLDKVIEFLLHAGLVEESGGRLQMGPQNLRLASDSPHLIRHHTNWRLQAAESLGQHQFTDLH